MAVLYVTSDRPGSGKTAVLGGLASHLIARGRSCAYFKPFSPALERDLDAEFFRADLGFGTSPPISDGRSPLSDELRGRLGETIEGLASTADVVLVEGPSLLTADGERSRVAGALLDSIEAKVLLVAGYGPGTTAESVLELCEPLGQRLTGVLLNGVTRYRGQQVRQDLEAAIAAGGQRVVGAIPEERLLVAATVEQVAEHMKAEWVLGREWADRLAESYLIGANVMDSAVEYFGRTEGKAVIVRGDRPDLQLAALATPLSCLLMTGGHRPNQYVYYEAQRGDVPLLILQEGTLAAAEALGRVVESSNFHHARKVEHYADLLARYADLEFLMGGLAV